VEVGGGCDRVEGQRGVPEEPGGGMGAGALLTRPVEDDTVFPRLQVEAHDADLADQTVV